jgi:hypothetical protein
MKYLFYTLMMLSLIVSQSCVEETEPGQQKLSIGFSATSIDNQTVSDLPANSKLVMNVQSPTGEAVMEFAEVQFQLDGQGFLTRPLDLPFGNYAITDFMIVNENDEIIYAVPKSTATLASDVTQPLNLEFDYSSSTAPQITDLRLLDVRNHKAEDFGYASFRKPGYGLNIVLNEKGSSQATSGKASIMNGNVVIATYSLAARMNHITIPAGLSGDHSLVISKDGFAGETFTLTELLQKKSKTIKVALEPALTMLAYAETWFEYSFDLTGAQGSVVTVDWGDGTTETHESNPEFNTFIHTYPADGNYNITVTGDLDEITSFYSFYGQGPMDEVNFQHLTELVDLRFGLSRSPKVLDLTHNTKLTSVSVGNLTNLENLYLPESHHISQLWIGDNHKLSTAAVDAVIDNLYQNIVSHNTRDGWFGFEINVDDEPGIVGPPSNEAVAKLRIMKHDYGWEIAPDL